MEKLIITVAPTGSVARKKDTAYIPAAPDEIAETAYLCEQEGASVIHVHCEMRTRTQLQTTAFSRRPWTRFANAHTLSSWHQPVEWQANQTKIELNHSERNQKWLDS
jgi:uncharacterized protein (DUF849 family)